MEVRSYSIHTARWKQQEERLSFHFHDLSSWLDIYRVLLDVNLSKM